MTDQKFNILVVGDWVIDENWLIASHNPETCTHHSKNHYRSLIDKPEAQILSLCGAGGVARALHGYFSEDACKNIKIYGLGLWHHKDTKLIASLFSSDKILDYETPFTLHGISPHEKNDISNKMSGKRLETKIGLNTISTVKGMSLCKKFKDTKSCIVADTSCIRYPGRCFPSTITLDKKMKYG